jgi:hypothetical protein
MRPRSRSGSSADGRSAARSNMSATLTLDMLYKP